jgi:methionine-rich copper-binding protein CopC
MRHSMAARLLLAFVVAMPGAALAQAYLQQAMPEANLAVPAAPVVRLLFSEVPDPARSSIAVTGPAGNVQAGQLGADSTQTQALILPLIGAMPDGRYVVRWTAVAAAGRTTGGSYAFVVDGREMTRDVMEETHGRP